MRSLLLLLSLGLPLLTAVVAQAATGETAAAARRLVICLDGTLNSPEQSVEERGPYKLYKPTNVLKTFRAVEPVAADGRTQIAYYSEGVGSFIGEPTPLSGLQKLVDNAAGGAFGVGFERGIKGAYRFLVANYHDGDDIFVFGFSRGAAQAQGLVRFIDWAHGLLAKDDEYYIAELFDGFSHGRKVETVLDTIRRRPSSKSEISATQAKCEETLRGGPAKPAAEAPPPGEAAPNLKRIGDPRPVEVRFLGVYDTVIALGSRLAADHGEGDVATIAPEFRFLTGKTPPAIVKTARHALSIDEKRWDFRPQVWDDSASPSIVQVWFPGVHSNVGGGYTHDGLANAALKWMTGEAHDAGLDLNKAYLAHYNPWVCGDRPETDKGFLKIAEFFRGKSGRGVRELPKGARLHESIARLLVADPTYRPENLLRYLAQDETRLDAFAGSQFLPGVKEIVAEFKRKHP